MVEDGDEDVLFGCSGGRDIRGGTVLGGVHGDVNCGGEPDFRLELLFGEGGHVVDVAKELEVEDWGGAGDLRGRRAKLR